MTTVSATDNDLAEWLAREITVGTLSPDWQALNVARALLSSGPLADRLAALSRVEMLAHQLPYLGVGEAWNRALGDFR